MRIWQRGLARFNSARAALGLPPLATLFDQLHAARRQLVLTSQAFDFPARLPANARYVGAVLDDPTWAPHEVNAPAGEAPLVLVSLSTTFQDQHGCLQRIVDALGMLPVRGVVTTGPAIDPRSVRAPANVLVVAAASHAHLLREASAMVTHGGHGTVIRSLAAGVPLAILHHGRDQADNAARVTSRGAGVEISRKASRESIAKVVTRLLQDPSYRAGARSLGEAIRRDAENGTLIEELESLPEAEASRATTSTGPACYASACTSPVFMPQGATSPSSTVPSESSR